MASENKKVISKNEELLATGRESQCLTYYHSIAYHTSTRNVTLLQKIATKCYTTIISCVTNPYVQVIDCSLTSGAGKMSWVWIVLHHFLYLVWHNAHLECKLKLNGGCQMVCILLNMCIGVSTMSLDLAGAHFCYVYPAPSKEEARVLWRQMTIAP